MRSWRERVLGVIFCAFGFAAAAQTGTIEGRVIDASTLEPLPFANIFINNTTLGTTTDASGNFALKNIPPGSHEVIFSFIGYSAYQARYQVNEDQPARVNIRLTPASQVLDEVAVKSSRDKAWEKQLKRFEKVFFGEDAFGQKCKINNPWVIDFQVQGPKLTATASAPIDITNEALGYKLHFHLKDFTTDGVTFSIIGNTRFEELPTTVPDDAIAWTKNRQTAYRRSARYFFKSLMDQQLEQDGFRLYKDAGPGTPARANNFNSELVKNVVPYLPVAIVSAGTTLHEMKVQIKERIEVHYLNEPTRAYFYKDVGHSVSWLESKGGYVRITREGVLLNPKELVLSGDMSIGRVAEMLPLDYQPGAIVRVKSSAKGFMAQRFEEKAYLHLSKPYFYPGETVWFKAYMSWRDAAKKDTLSNVLYVDLIDPKMNILQSRTLRMDTLRNGQFRLPDQLEAGLYYIRAYTQWMLNYGETAIFSIGVPVLGPYDKMVGGKTREIKNSEGLEITTDREVYSTRQKVAVTLTTANEDGKPVAADLSMSVVDMQQVKEVPWTKSICTALIFGEFLPTSGQFPHPLEKGFTVQGRFMNERGKAVAEDLTVIIGNFEGLLTTKSDDKGAFYLRDLPFYDSITLAIQGRNKKGAYGKVSLVPASAPIPVFRSDSYKYEVEAQSSVQRVLSRYELQSDVIVLNEVSIKSTRIEDTKPTYNLYGKADRVYQHDDLVKRGANLGAILQSLMPGYTLSFVTDHWYLIRDRNIASSGTQFSPMSQGKQDRAAVPTTQRALPGQKPSEPLLVIDNALFVAGVAETVGDKLMSINPANVDRVEVNSPMSSLTGALGSAGVINVFMKNGTNVEAVSSYQMVRVKGFDVPLDFNSPNYEELSDDPSPDVRSTIHWKPVITPNSDGISTLSFYTSDLGGRYLITVEGLLVDGTPVHVEKIIEVK